MSENLKKCTLCKIEKNKEEFNFKNKKTGLIQSKCKICTRSQSKKHYDKNKDYYIEKAKVAKETLKERNRMYIWEILRKSKCVDCGNGDPLVLDFDHIMDKNKEISKLIFSAGIEVLQQEVKKCEIRCCNCHKIKTHKVDNILNWKLKGHYD